MSRTRSPSGRRSIRRSLSSRPAKEHASPSIDCRGKRPARPLGRVAVVEDLHAWRFPAEYRILARRGSDRGSGGGGVKMKYKTPPVEVDDVLSNEALSADRSWFALRPI